MICDINQFFTLFVIKSLQINIIMRLHSYQVVQWDITVLLFYGL